MARTVTDLAKLLDVMVGYDPEDPTTALGVGKHPDTYTRFLDRDGLKGARIGILRESMVNLANTTPSEPDSQDFKDVTAVFDKAVADLQMAGATVVDPITIPNLQAALAKRAGVPGAGNSAQLYFARNPNSPFKTQQDMEAHPDFSKMIGQRRDAAWAADGRIPPAPALRRAVPSTTSWRATNWRSTSPRSWRITGSMPSCTRASTIHLR